MAEREPKPRILSRVTEYDYEKSQAVREMLRDINRPILDIALALDQQSEEYKRALSLISSIAHLYVDTDEAVRTFPASDLIKLGQVPETGVRRILSRSKSFQINTQDQHHREAIMAEEEDCIRIERVPQGIQITEEYKAFTRGGRDREGRPIDVLENITEVLTLDESNPEEIIPVLERGRQYSHAIAYAIDWIPQNNTKPISRVVDIQPGDIERSIALLQLAYAPDLPDIPIERFQHL